MPEVKNIFPRPIRPFRVQRKRRMITAGAISLLFLSIFFLAIGSAYWSVVALTASAVLGIALQFATRNLSNSIDLITDERERQLRDHAHRIAYWIMAGVLGGIVGGILGYFSTRKADTPVLLVADLARLETLLGLAIFAGVFFGLPTWIIAWLEPDSLEDERT